MADRNNKNNIALFDELTNCEKVKFKDNDFELEVSVSPKEETVWLSKANMALLFDRDRSVISKHIKNIFDEGECSDVKSNVHFLHVPFSDKSVEYYSLDIIEALKTKIYKL